MRTCIYSRKVNAGAYPLLSMPRPFEQSFLVVAIQGAPTDEIRGIIDAAAAIYFASRG